MTDNDLKDNFDSVLLFDNQLFNFRDADGGLSDIFDTVRTVFVMKQHENTEHHKAVIHSIAKACKLQEQEYVIVTDAYSWKDFRAFEQIKEVILMGVSESDFNILIKLPVHYAYSFDNRNWIKTADVGTLNTDMDIKTVFWKEVLKPYFLGA